MKILKWKFAKIHLMTHFFHHMEANCGDPTLVPFSSDTPSQDRFIFNTSPLQGNQILALHILVSVLVILGSLKKVASEGPNPTDRVSQDVQGPC